jgi:hypothetical protein
LRRSALLLAAAASAVLAVTSPVGAQRAATAPAECRAAVGSFPRLVACLSEPGGYFDTDNLISNERSYLHVMGALARLGVRGGAYIGVGPDQNFSYIARVRPSIAFIIDVRRDNMLQHLLFKALFARARTRAEYLALLVGRPVPAGVERWRDRPVAALVAYVDSTPATPASTAAARAAVLAEVRRTGVPLSAADLATIQRFHTAFIEAGLGLQFTSTGRAPQSYYPTLRQLLLERDLDGRQASYLANESDFQFVKELERRDLVVPVVGNLAGPHALPAIGRLVRQRGERVSAFYTSNVEDYLIRDGSFEHYARTVAALPHDTTSVIIRSYFGGGFFREPLPQSVPGYYSTQLLQRISAFAARQARRDYSTYRDLAGDGPLPLRD